MNTRPAHHVGGPSSCLIDSGGLGPEEMDGLAEIVAEYESTHEQLTEAEIEAAARDMFGPAGATTGRGAA